jgi:hypothetical protein
MSSTEVQWYFCQARLIGSTLGCPCKNFPLNREPVTALSCCRILTVLMIIVPNLLWRTFRYWAVRVSDVWGLVSSPIELRAELFPKYCLKFGPQVSEAKSNTMS